MLAPLLVSAAALGFFGSAHCALMCGPLAVAGCTTGRDPRSRAFALYTLGRLASYAFAGALFGQLGLRAGQMFPLAALSHALTLAVSAAALARGLMLLSAARKSALVPLPVGQVGRRARPLTALVAAILPQRGLGLGLATGLLPCGMLAGGWALAAASGDPASGALLMVVFCVATTPALLASVLAGGRIRNLAARPVLAGLLWTALGLWLGLRPLLAATGRCH